MLLSQADMPFTSSGLVPDIIMNPHALPSRMTISQIIEALFSKVCAEEGFVTDGTIFNSVDIDKICNQLKELGCDSRGEEEMYNGETGEKIKVKIFVCPTYYQRLQKFVSDAMYAVSSGPTCALTMQPLGGKNINGGLRLGEMERDVLMANSCVDFLTEKFFRHSDGIQLYVCVRCGDRDSVVVNEERSIYKCKRCGDLADIIKMPYSWSAKRFVQQLRAINVGTRYRIKPPTFEEGE